MKQVFIIENDDIKITDSFIYACFNEYCEKTNSNRFKNLKIIEVADILSSGGANCTAGNHEYGRFFGMNSTIPIENVLQPKR